MTNMWFPILLVGLVVVGSFIRWIRRPSKDSATCQSSWQRQDAITAGVVLIAGLSLWGFMRLVGARYPTAGLWVAIVLTVVAVWASKRFQFGAWLPFVWLGAAVTFAHVSAVQGLIVQPGSILTLFGSGKVLVILSLVCIGGAVVMALIEQSKATWFAITIVVIFMIIPKLVEPYRHPGRRPTWWLQSGVWDCSIPQRRGYD
jgi:hypothetical protein